MKKLTLAYFGSPYFSSLFLEKLLTDTSINRIIEVKFIVTQPDRPVGRKQLLTPTPVKQVAKKYGILVKELKKNTKLQAPITKKTQNSKRFENLNFENLSLFRIFKNIDLALVYAFGQIIPKNILDLPKYGFWNIHPSLLPKYRGPSPTVYPLILGEKKTGVTIFKMDEEIDHGPIIAQKQLKILETDRRPKLEIKLTNLAFVIFKKIICRSFSRPFKSATFTLPSLKPQNHQLATHTRLLKKEDGFIPLSILKKALNNKPVTFENLPEIIKEYLNQYPKEKEFFLKKNLNFSLLIFNLFRGLYPWPGVWTRIQPTKSQTAYYKRLKITDLTLINKQLVIKKVQLEGKKEVNFAQFNNTYKVF